MPKEKEVQDPYDYFLDSIKGITEKMNPSDYLYLSEKIWDFRDRVHEIKNR